MAKTQKLLVSGHRQLDKKLAEFPLKLQKRAVRKSLRKAGKLIQAKAKANITQNDTVETGFLRRGIKVRAMPRSRVRVGLRVTSTERKKTEKSKYPFGGAQLEFGRRGVRAFPFLRPAGYDNERQIRDFVIQDVSDELDTMRVQGFGAGNSFFR